jgi:AraC-like DNA-binding protein
VDLTLSINEVARLVGYDDPSYFTRWFRQHVGVSPREWRENRPCEAA